MGKLLGSAFAVALALGMLSGVIWVVVGLLSFHSPAELAALVAGFLWRIL